MGDVSKSCPYDLWDEEIVYPGKWMTTRRIKFRLKSNGQEGTWESAHRSVAKDYKNADCIGVLAILKKEGRKYFVLIRQYRIPTRSWVVEFPAGHIDDTDPDIEEAGIRELKEETGYTPTKIHGWSYGRQFLDTGLGDESFRFLFVEIDGDAEINKNPQQQLDHDEHCEVLLVECDQLLNFLDDINKNSTDTEVLACLYTFAVGYCMRNKFGI
uniref:Nudix hydrolase domain-containing protein n=1 Tax=Acrobeloides nanus TaxID=290746 RepID=A0A914BZH2_9BILA